MKAIITIFMLCSVALASITLTNPFSASVGGTVIETDPAAGLMTYSVNFFGGIPSLTLVFPQGTISGQAIVQGATAPVITINIRLDTGVWTKSDGTSGTLTAGQLNTFIGIEKGQRNALESLIVNDGLIAGTQVSW